MTTMQFLTAVFNWLQGDPTHVVAAAAILNSIIPTPNPATPVGKAYKVIEMIALCFLRAKESGVPAQTPAALADQIAEAIAKRTAVPAAPAQQ
jgi:hypothetical protein